MVVVRVSVLEVVPAYSQGDYGVSVVFDGCLHGSLLWGGKGRTERTADIVINGAAFYL